MTLNFSIEKLTALVAEKPELATALQAAPSPAAAAELLAKAGQENGVAVDPAALAAYLTERVKAAESGELSDADLDRVAGGGLGGAVAFSILTLGIGCGGVSLMAKAAEKDCGSELKRF